MKRIFVFKLLLIGFGLSTFSTQMNAAEIIVEAESAGTSSTGNWYSASGASMPYEGNRGRYTIVGGEVETYTFTPNLPETTEYSVEVYNSCYSPRSHQVLHIIQHANGTAHHIIDQDCQSDPFVGQWRSLGTYTFNQGTAGGLTIDTTDSNNSYVGATAVRFISDTGSEPTNTPPMIEVNASATTVDAGEQVTFLAQANDNEDGDISQLVEWSALNQTSSGANFSVYAGENDFIVNVQVTDSGGLTTTSPVAITVNDSTPSAGETTQHLFDCDALEPLTGLTTNNAAALPSVGKRCGRYVAELTDNSDNRTLHFNNDQGRFDGQLTRFPFTAIARNVGTAPMGNPEGNHNVAGNSFHFVGLQVHHNDLENRNSTHLVVGQRGNIQDTIEGKMTYNGNSDQSDIGSVLPQGRADLMIVGDSNGNIKAYWQLPNLTGNSDNDDWIAYDGTGDLPGTLPNWQGNNVYVGLITYAYYTSAVPFMGVVDSLEIIEQ